MVLDGRSALLVSILTGLGMSTGEHGLRSGSTSASLGTDPGTPLSIQRFHPSLTPFPGTLTRDQLGTDLATLGDLDGNGVVDIALGAAADHVQGDCWQGAVWIQFLEGPGDSIAQQKIREGEGGFDGILDPLDRFGHALAGIGDLDGDGLPDLAVGAPGDDDLSGEAGAVWILFLNDDGTVRAHTKILPPVLTVEAFATHGGIDMRVRRFGTALVGLGDIDGDGTIELAVGALRGSLPGEDSGAVWILSLRPDGSLQRRTKISAVEGGFTGHLDAQDYFGSGLGVATAHDGAARTLLVGAPGDDDLVENGGALWSLSIATEGTVVGHTKISGTSGGGPTTLGFNSRFGESACELGDLDADGIADLVVGAPTWNSGGSLWLLYMNADGTVRSALKIFQPDGGPQADEEPLGGWGASVAPLGDLDGNGIPELLAGAPGRFVPITGWVWALDLRRNGTIRDARLYGQSSWTAPAFLHGTTSTFGAAMLRLGDLDGDGGEELLVGQPGDDAVWRIELDEALAVENVEKLSFATGFPAGLARRDLFGTALEWIGDVDGNGFDDVAIGAPGDEDGHTGGGEPGQFSYGAVWILFLGDQGKVLGVQEISGTEGGLTLALSQGSEFGASIAALGDLDDDGVPDLAVGAPGDHIAVSHTGAVYVLFLDPDGTVKADTRFFSLAPLGLDQKFGSSVEHLGQGRLAIGELVPIPGRIWMAKLGPDGQPQEYFEISPGLGGFGGTLYGNDRFGSAMARVGDLDGDGLAELAVSSPGSHTPTQGPNEIGLLWLLFLDGTGHVRTELAFGPEHPAIALPIDHFVTSVAPAGDRNGDGVLDLWIGCEEDRNFVGSCQEGDVGTFALLTLDGEPSEPGMKHPFGAPLQGNGAR